MEKSIDDCINALPEIYQRIYGHEEYNQTSHLCGDRAEQISKVVKALQEKEGANNLRVLDLGCAQGYFCFTLAELGCEVSGIDFCSQNIDLCNALKAENDIPCNFTNDKLTEEFIRKIPDGEYDVILCLSIIHHVANEYGFDYAQKIMEGLARKSKIVIAELALKEEPLYWNKNLPENYDDWFKNIAFYDELALFPTHLSETVRPLILLSDRYFYCGLEFFEFTEWKKKAYELKREDNTRRYYMSGCMLMKLNRDNPAVTEEISREVNFIKENADLDFVPEVLAFERKGNKTLAAYRIDRGTLLVKALEDGHRPAFKKIFLDILDECVALEGRGLYHGDLRLWNICVKEDGSAFLIDFGNIQKSRDDSVAKLFNPNFPFTVYDAYMSLVFDVLTGKRYDLIREYEIYDPTAYYDLSKLGTEYADFFKSYLLIPTDELNFKKIQDAYEKTVISDHRRSFSASEELKICSVLQERGLCEKAGVLELSKTDIDLRRLRSELSAQDNRIAGLEQTVASQNQRLSEQEARLTSQDARIAGLNQRLAEQDRELGELRGLIMNTRHRTLFGAAEWLAGKITRPTRSSSAPES